MTYLLRSLLLALAGLLALACTETHSPVGGDAGIASPDAAAPGDDAGPPSSACADLCQARRDDPTSGGCPFDTVPGSGRCEDRCAEVAGLSAATREAFEWCVTTDPLCFQTIDQCVYGRRYPESVSIPTTITAEGLDAYEGRAVVVAIQNGVELYRRDAVVTDGGFEATFDEPLPAAWPPSAFGYVDVDEDGRCGRGVDVTFYESLTQVGTFDAPAYQAHLVLPPDRDLGFVCDEL